MKTTALFSLSLRSVPALCLIAASLLAASPAVAAEDGTASPASGKMAPAQDAVTEEIAVRVRDRARFAARVAPVISRVLLESRDCHCGELDEASDQVVDALWDLRFSPALQAKWLDKLGGSGKTPANAEEREIHAVSELLSFMEEARNFARESSLRRSGSLWTMFRGMVRSAAQGESRNKPAVETRNVVAVKLAEVNAWEKALAEAVELMVIMP